MFNGHHDVTDHTESKAVLAEQLVRAGDPRRPRAECDYVGGDHAPTAHAPLPPRAR